MAVFFYPGLILLLLGIIGSVALLFGELKLLNVVFSINTLLYCMLFTTLGLNALSMNTIVRLYAIKHGFLPEKVVNMQKQPNDDAFIFSGIAAIIIGVVLSVFAVVAWKSKSFGDLDPEMIMRITIPAVAFIANGFQCVMSGFLMSIIKVKSIR